MIGEAGKNLIVGALGSPQVQPFYTVQILDGIRKQAGAIKVSYAAGTSEVALPASAVTVPGQAVHGFKAQYFKGTRLEGKPILERVDRQIQIKTDRSPAPGVPATD